MLRILPSHESYRNVDNSIAVLVELDEAERHLQYLVQGESSNTEKKIFLTTNLLRGAGALLSSHRLLGPMAPSVLLVASDG